MQSRAFVRVMQPITTVPSISGFDVPTVATARVGGAVALAFEAWLQFLHTMSQHRSVEAPPSSPMQPKFAHLCNNAAVDSQGKIKEKKKIKARDGELVQLRRDAP